MEPKLLWQLMAATTTDDTRYMYVRICLTYPYGRGTCNFRVVFVFIHRMPISCGIDTLQILISTPPDSSLDLWRLQRVGSAGRLATDEGVWDPPIDFCETMVATAAWASEDDHNFENFIFDSDLLQTFGPGRLRCSWVLIYRPRRGAETS